MVVTAYQSFIVGACERPRGYAAEKRDELASFQIEPSARTSQEHAKFSLHDSTPPSGQSGLLCRLRVFHVGLIRPTNSWHVRLYLR
jgi:hypothetical protein